MAIDKRISYQWGGPGGKSPGTSATGGMRGETAREAGIRRAATAPAPAPAPQREERVSPIESMARVGDISLAGKTIEEAERTMEAQNEIEGDARVTLNLKNYPTDSQASSSLGPFTSSTTTDKIDTRARARAISLKVDNTSTGQHWKLGTFRLDIQPDGRR